MDDENPSELRQYTEIIKDENALKIVYYLYKYNPNVPIDEINKELGMDVSTIESCMKKLEHNGIIFKNPETNAYSMTPFGRNAFKELIEEES